MLSVTPENLAPGMLIKLPPRSFFPQDDFHASATVPTLTSLLSERQDSFLLEKISYRRPDILRKYDVAPLDLLFFCVFFFVFLFGLLAFLGDNV